MTPPRLSAALLVLAAAAACAGTRAPSSTDPAAAARCTKDDDCALLRGDTCNPCGGCPSDPPVAATRAQLEAIRADPACTARIDRAGQAPSCSPCAGAAVLPDAYAACLGGRCSLRCWQLPDSGALAPVVSVSCAAP